MIQKNYEQLVKELEKEVRLLKEKYRILEETTPAILFEYLADHDKMIFFYNLPDNKERKEIPNYQEFLEMTPLVHPDHLGKFKKVLSDACVQPVKGDLEYLSLISGNADYEWHKAYYASIADGTGKIISVIGRIQNTHDSSLAIKKIIHKVETDILTGFYKKEAAMERITTWLKHNPTNDAYMVMVDLTNFKDINDKYGHIYGDEILKEITGIMEISFAGSCMFCRLSGAEFMIFASGKELRAVECQADDFLNRLSEQTLSISTPLKCSIGIAGRAGRDDGFDDILNRAENAISYSKQAGVNGYYIIRD